MSRGLFQFEIVDEDTKAGGERAIADLIRKYNSLPASLAKKHLKAAMRRTIKPGVPVLRKYTPPLNTRRGRRAKGDNRSTGALRRMVTTRVGIKGTEAKSVLWGALGYKYFGQDRKPIWMEFGTKRGVRKYRMIENAMGSFARPTATALAREMAIGLEKAVKEAAKRPAGRTRRR